MQYQELVFILMMCVIFCSSRLFLLQRNFNSIRHMDGIQYMLAQAYYEGYIQYSSTYRVLGTSLGI